MIPSAIILTLFKQNHLEVNLHDGIACVSSEFECKKLLEITDFNSTGRGEFGFGRGICCHMGFRRTLLGFGFRTSLQHDLENLEKPTSRTKDSPQEKDRPAL